MRIMSLAGAVSAALLGAIVISGNAQVGSDHESKPDSTLDWVTVVNNDYQMPGAPAGRTFNSYNQPSVNRHGLVVIRARSRGGPPLGPPTHGIYTRDMSDEASVITRILDKSTAVPDPNNLETTFVETPSFPRIDMDSDTIATRGNHQPVWGYGEEGDETRAGTTVPAAVIIIGKHRGKSAAASTTAWYPPNDAWLERTSMFWARVIRGKASKLRMLRPDSAQGSNSERWRAGDKVPISHLKPGSGSSAGQLTVTKTSVSLGISVLEPP